MIKLNKNSTVYVFAPSDIETGGIECSYSLAKAYKDLGINTKMVLIHPSLHCQHQSNWKEIISDPKHLEAVQIPSAYSKYITREDIVNIVEDLFMKIDEYAMKKNLSIIFDTDNEEINVNIDKVEIERIILNLLSNCIKCTNNGGCIFINIYDKKDSVTISVKDNGVGIPKNKIDIIFDEFTQVDRTLSRGAEGSGIGLTIVKNLVELHKGSISVNSEEGKGTEFIINIPIVHLSYEDCEEDKRIYNIDEKIKIEFSDIYY